MEIRKINMKDRLAEMEEELDTLKRQKKPSQEFKMPRKWGRTMNLSLKPKAMNKLLFFYFRKNGKIEPPKLVSYDDDVVVYNHKAYHVDPRAVWQWGKFKCYVYKEMDRRPVSNLNYKLIQERGDLTDGDEILIKATMRAMQDANKKPINKQAMIIVGIIVVVALAYMFTAGA